MNILLPLHAAPLSRREHRPSAQSLTFWRGATSVYAKAIGESIALKQYVGVQSTTIRRFVVRDALRVELSSDPRGENSRLRAMFTLSNYELHFVECPRWVIPYPLNVLLQESLSIVTMQAVQVHLPLLETGKDLSNLLAEKKKKKE